MSGEELTGASTDGSPTDAHAEASTDGSPADTNTGASTNGSPADVHTGAFDGSPEDSNTGASPSDLLDGSPEDPNTEASTNGSPAGEEHTGASTDRSTADEYPWLVFFDRKDPKNQTFCRISSSGPICSESRCMPELQNNEILWASPGSRWLILLERKTLAPRLSIWNPTTKESIALPRLNIFEAGKTVMSCSPDDPRCLIYFFPMEYHQVLYCRVGDERWSKFKYAASIRSQIQSCNGRAHKQACCHIRRPVSFQGKVYGMLTCFNELVEISVDEFNNCSTIVLTRNPEPQLLEACVSTLVSWEDHHLYLVMAVSVHCQDFVLQELPDIRVMEFNFSTSSWLIVPSLNGGAVFVGDAYSLAYSTTTSNSTNKWSFIHYRSWYYQTLFSHRIEDGKVTSYAPSPTYLPEQDTLWLPSWIMPAQPDHLDLEDSLYEDTSKQVDDLPTSKSVVMEKGSARGKNINWFNPMKHCSNKRKVVEDVPVGAEATMHCSKKQKAVENVPVDTLMQRKVIEDVSKDAAATMHCSKKQKAVDTLMHHSMKEKVLENGSASARWNDAIKPCSKKRKGLENVPVDADCSKKQKVVQNGVHSTSLCDLLPELIREVAEKVSSFVEYTYFLNINKLGSDVARSRKNKFRPCLIYRDNMETRFYHIVDSNISRNVLVEVPQQVRGKSIGCCRDGWLLVEDGNSCCLFNPLTRQVIETVGCKNRNGDYGISNLTFIGGKPSLSFPEKSSVLAMSLVYPRQGSLLEPGAAPEAGKALWWKLVVEKFQASCNSPVLVGEEWYYLGRGKSDGRLGRLRLTNMEEGNFEWEEEALKRPCECTRMFLTECGGELVSVFIGGRDEIWVRVFKVRSGDAEKKWEEMDSLGGYCLYLGSTSSISCLEDTADVADRVYFPKFYKDGLVYYSLKTKKWHSIGNELEEVKRHHPITMFSNGTWIIPDYSH